MLLTFCQVSDDDQDMQQRSEDLSQCTLEEIVALKAENQSWHRELRRRVNDLMDGKLAKRMGQEEYAAKRKIMNEEVAECHRQATILTDEILIRRSKKKRCVCHAKRALFLAARR